jgi:hypothetical protein
MRVVLSIPDRIGREAERLAREDGVSLAEYAARAIGSHVKAASRQRAIDAINAMLGSAGRAGAGMDDHYRERRS